MLFSLVFFHCSNNSPFQLVLNAAKSSEIVTSLFPAGVREKLLEETKTNKKLSREKGVQDGMSDEVMAELYPHTTVSKSNYLNSC